MMYATVTLATKLLAGGILNAGTMLELHLTPVPDGVSRARASAKFYPALGIPYSGQVVPVELVDVKGYPLRWDLKQAASFLARALPGTPHPLTIILTDCEKVPAKWTDARRAAVETKVQALDPAAIRAQAADKRATVQDWADGERKTAVIDAAARMDACADLIDAIRNDDPFGAGQGGGEGEGEGMN
jgi:hypothetical protein